MVAMRRPAGSAMNETHCPDCERPYPEADTKIIGYCGCEKCQAACWSRHYDVACRRPKDWRAETMKLRAVLAEAVRWFDEEEGPTIAEPDWIGDARAALPKETKFGALSGDGV